MSDSDVLPNSLCFDDHLARPWRVHLLVPDFQLLDVWRFRVRAKEEDFPRFVQMMTDMDRTLADTNLSTRALFRLRRGLGKLFGWERESGPLPIPGCHEYTVIARLPQATASVTPSVGAQFSPVYEDDRESLSEISNGTVHALIHLGWIELGCGEFLPQMAVYAKPRGRSGQLYMRLIRPFRHWIVYPSLLEAVRRRWTREIANRR